MMIPNKINIMTTSHFSIRNIFVELAVGSVNLHQSRDMIMEAVYRIYINGKAFLNKTTCLSCL
jgi:hypothetical protein